MKEKNWLIIWFAAVAILMLIVGGFVYKVDPYFHYHAPDTSKYFYSIDNERCQNDGISRHFTYDTIITGTSMTENFKTSEIDEIFDANSVKVPFKGGTYKEINDNLRNALKSNSELKTVIRGLDCWMIIRSADGMREDLGEYPSYLYDDNPFNDVYYFLNKDVIFTRAYNMTLESKADGFEPGITSFDEYSNWMEGSVFGDDILIQNAAVSDELGTAVHLTDEERETIYENITQNVTSLADEYSDVDFYYFLTPYSVIWYKSLLEDGTIYKQFEAEEYAIELILQHDNIKLFSFNDLEWLVADINNYKNELHYGSWINSYIAQCMHENRNLLTEDNYRQYLENEHSLYLNFDYDSLNEQENYDTDYYAAALVNGATWGVEPIDVLKDYADSVEIYTAETVDEGLDGNSGLLCKGKLGSDIGAIITLDSIGKHNYLVFYGKKVSGEGQPYVLALDAADNQLGVASANGYTLDNEWHRYIIDLTGTQGDVTLYISGGTSDDSTSEESAFVFSKIGLY